MAFGASGIWTPALVGQLRELWDQGLSTEKIGRRLGVSKGAVVGKANRLKLAGRGSPLPKRKEEARPMSAGSQRTCASGAQVRQPIRQICPACGGVRSMAALTDKPLCHSEPACMAALLKEWADREDAA